MQAEEVERLERGVKEVRELKEMMFKHNQELFALRTAERNIIAEIAGGQAQNKNLGVKVRVEHTEKHGAKRPNAAAWMRSLRTTVEANSQKGGVRAFYGRPRPAAQLLTVCAAWMQSLSYPAPESLVLGAGVAAQVTDLDTKIARQTELLYAAEFNLQQLERKVARAGGERSDEEKRLLNMKIEQLAAVLVSEVNPAMRTTWARLLTRKRALC